MHLYIYIHTSIYILHYISSYTIHLHNHHTYNCIYTSIQRQIKLIKMAARYVIPRAFLVCLVAVMMSINMKQPACEATRVLDEDEEEWMRKGQQPPELLLASLQWRDVSPPGPNPGTNGATTLGTKNFAAGNSNTHVHHGRPSSAAAYPRHNIQFGVAENA